MNHKARVFLLMLFIRSGYSHTSYSAKHFYNDTKESEVNNIFLYWFHSTPDKDQKKEKKKESSIHIWINQFIAHTIEGQTRNQLHIADPIQANGGGM